MDIINFDSLLNSKQIQLRNDVKQELDFSLRRTLDQAHREGVFPEKYQKLLAEKKWIGANIKDYQCLGLDNISYGLLMQELERFDSGLRTFASVQGALVIYPIYTYGSQELKDLYIADLLSTKKIGSFALTEPDFGSDPGAMKTIAKKVKGGYEITGEKSWLTNGQCADIVIVWAKLDNQICGFILDTQTKGFKATAIEGKLSMRVSHTSHMSFNKCFVPESHRLHQASGIKHALNCLNEARFGIIWGSIGAALDCYEAAINYVKNRKGFKNKSLASFQLVQAKIVKMAQNISQAQLLAMHITKLKKTGECKPHHISLGKMNNCSMALDCARIARDILGANGVLDSHRVMRHLMNLETVNTYEGTEDIHRLILGKTITGENGFF